MHIAVLMANTDESEFAQRHPKDGEKYAALMSSVRPAWRVSSFNVKDGEFPADITAFDGIIITGSPASVHDEATWVEQLLVLVREAYVAQLPIFGACFGHQAIAIALGGQVEKNPSGWCFGLIEMDVVARPSWYAGPDRFRQYAAHIEQVTRLPKGGKVIFRAPDCPVAGFVCGSQVFTTQNHPEMTPDFIAALVDELSDTMEKDVTDRARASLSQTADTLIFAESISQFFEIATAARSSA